MPKCWFVLLRFWLRVDRVLVRLHETRLMGSFNRAPGAPLVSREVRQSEGTFEHLRSAGAPPDGVSIHAPFRSTASRTSPHLPCVSCGSCAASIRHLGTSCEQEGVPEQGTAEEITSAGALPAGVILFAL